MRNLANVVLGLTLVTITTAAAYAQTTWTVDRGGIRLNWDSAALQALGLAAADHGEPAGQSVLAARADSSFALTEKRGIMQGAPAGEIALDAALALRGPAGEIALDGLALASLGEGRWVLRREGLDLFELRDQKVGLDRPGALLLIEAAEVAITAEFAAALGEAKFAGQSIGSLLAQLELAYAGGDVPPTHDQAFAEAQADPDKVTCGQEGPDVIVGALPGVSNYASVGGIEAFAVGTDSCNIGDTPLKWISTTNQHPVIGQNMYRLKDGRFEQIGLSWLKHGFTALADNLCGCGCQNPGTGSLLGVGCSDPYSSGLNGQQDRLGPRFEVNPHTGFYQFPYTAQGQTGNSIYKRLQVAISDLDPAQNGGGLYFVEGQYVTPDDAAAGNQDNNASYRQVGISGSGTTWNASMNGMPPTQTEQAAIFAWGRYDSGVVYEQVRVPGEGLMVLAGKATDLGGGWFRYEYALQNLNSDRAVGGLSIPLDGVAGVANIGFHDVNYHSGEPFDGADWPGVRGPGGITWATTPYSENANANALRWGTLYNFRFEANRTPVRTNFRLDLFKPGSPQFVLVSMVGPDPGVLDCNTNGVEDADDIANGTSSDCNDNDVPDECEEFPPTPIAAIPVVSGLSSPVGVYAPPGDFDRLFVIEQNSGLIRIVQDGTILSPEFLNLGSLISNGGERGLLGLAFDPDYATNGYFYVDYTNTSGNTVVARYSVSADPNVADPTSATILLTVNQDFANHNGGALAFGPDGYLYVAMGDGGSGGDPNNRAQDLNVLLGKILRLDVNNPPTYVPADNPFVGIPGRDEIWAYGLRNPWRITFDRLTGDLYIADVGQGAWEEIDVQPAASTGGENYGWRCYEGNAPYNTTGCPDAATMTFPVLTYSHAGGACSITGGYVYRGCEIPHLRGTYFFADYCADFIRSMRYTPGDPIPPVWQDRTAELGPLQGAIVSFGEDAAGELYIVTSAGIIYKIVNDPAAGVCGNGLIEGEEECDDFNIDSGDGCSSACLLEGGNNDACADAQNVCSGAYAGSNASATGDGVTTCGATLNSRDRWYVYVPSADGLATFSLCEGTSFDTVLSVHSGCPGAAGNTLACDDDACGQTDGPSSITMNVTAGQNYFIRVAGNGSLTGNYVLNVEGPPCTASTCGNGVLDPGEECEPPGTSSCDNLCRRLPCEHVLLDDNFETDLGWTTGVDATAVAGFWQRGVPVNDPSWPYDPITDSDGSGQCYLTSNYPGNSDVDDGAVLLTSPTIDLSMGEVTIRYDYYLWINNSNDGMRVEINNAGGEGPWTLLTTHNIGGGTSWRTQVFTHEDLLNAGVVLTDSMKLRFSAYDVDPQGQVEAGVDAVRIVASCVDCDSNGVDDRVEIADGSALDCNSNNIPDSCDVAAGTSVDCDGGPVGSVAGGAAIVNSICFGCHDSDGSGGPGFPGPSIRGRDRLFIRHKLLPPTDHPGGAFPDFTWQDFADIEAYLSDVGGRARPNLVPDECDATSDCNSNGVADGCDLAGGAGVDLDHSGVLDACEAGCGTTTGDVDGDCDVDLGDFAGLQRCYTGSLAGGTALASACLCLDVDGDGDVDEADYAGFAGVLAGPASPDESCTPSP